MEGRLAKIEQLEKLKKAIRKHKEKRRDIYISKALGIVTITAPLIATATILYTSFAKRNQMTQSLDYNNNITTSETNEDPELWEEVAGTVILGSMTEGLFIALAIGTGVLPLDSAKEETKEIKSLKIKQKKLEEEIKM